MRNVAQIGARVSLRFNDAVSYFFGHVKGLIGADVIVEMEEARAVYFGPQKVLEMRVYGGDVITIVQVVTLSEQNGIIRLRATDSVRVERDSSMARLRCRIPVEYEVLSGATASPLITGMVVDISMGGLGIQSDDPPDVGNRLRMTLQLGRQRVVLEGTVRNKVEEGPGRFGVQFEGVSRVDEAKLMQFLREIMCKAA